jgi:hypothetical protein
MRQMLEKAPIMSCRFDLMPGSAPAETDPLPLLWKLLLFRIARLEQRIRVRQDWEQQVFGFKLGRPR